MLLDAILNAVNGWVSLEGLDDKALESKYNNALKYKASNAGKYINKHEALVDDITDRIVTWSRATQGKAKVQSKQDVKALNDW